MNFVISFTAAATLVATLLVLSEVRGEEEKGFFRNYYSWDDKMPLAPAVHPVPVPVAPDARLSAELTESCQKEPGCKWLCEEGGTLCRCRCKLAGDRRHGGVLRPRGGARRHW